MDDDKRRVSAAGRRNQCPKCGSRNIARIGYGMPRPEFFESEEYKSGDVLVGGCVIFDEMPDLHCHACETEWASDHA
jgi:hypothetical protein